MGIDIPCKSRKDREYMSWMMYTSPDNLYLCKISSQTLMSALLSHLCIISIMILYMNIYKFRWFGPGFHNCLRLRYEHKFVFFVRGGDSLGRGEASKVVIMICCYFNTDPAFPVQVNFRDVGHALISLFRVATTDGWFVFPRFNSTQQLVG